MWSITRKNELGNFFLGQKSHFLPLWHRFRRFSREKKHGRGRAKRVFSDWVGQRPPELTFLSFYCMAAGHTSVLSHPEGLGYSFWRQEGENIAVPIDTFFFGVSAGLKSSFFWHIGFFEGVKQRLPRTKSIINVRDGLTKWFLEGMEEDVVRKIKFSHIPFSRRIRAVRSFFCQKINIL